jgi:MoaA/NifB/PqqE/SkfB family radical SAM enzyme
MDLGIMYSHTCNIACRHCGILSSPHNKARMKLEDALRFIDEAGALHPFIRTIAFTGGEPFLFQDEHAAMFARCRELGLATRVVTNGFWAPTVDAGLKVLRRMQEAGLGELNFSADKWHLEFLDPAVLRNALECARQLRFVRIVSFVIDSDEHPIGEFCRLYEIPADSVRLFRRSVFEEIYADPARAHELNDKIFLSAGHVIGLGRAAEYPEEVFDRPLDAYANAGCDEIANRPVIYPDGDFQACCCAGGKVKAFSVGNLHSASLRDLIARMRDRTHFRFINAFGPKEMYEAVRQVRPSVKRKLLHSSICEICVRANDGVTPEEMDDILEHRAMSKALDLLAGTPTESPPE